MYIDYIDLPKIPNEVLESKDDILAKDSLSIRNYDGTAVNPLRVSGDAVIVSPIVRKLVSKNLEDWLQSVCSFPVDARYLVLSSQVPIHRDPKYRPQAYNYIIHAGGDNVATTIYDDDRKVLKSMVIPEQTWYCLDTGRLHGIHGIVPNDQRIVLSINYTGND